METILTFDDIKNSDSWRKQIQLSDSFPSFFSNKPQNHQNLSLYRRRFDPSMKKAFKDLTQFYIEKYGVESDKSIILYGEGAFQPFFSPLDGTEILSYQVQNAAKRLDKDIKCFNRISTPGHYLRLRLQGGEVINGDSVWHDDGAANTGIRYSGAMTQEAHDYDVLEIENNLATVKDSVRILVVEHGDIWKHNTLSLLKNCFPYLFPMKRRVHRKSPIDGEPGLILTMQ